MGFPYCASRAINGLFEYALQSINARQNIAPSSVTLFQPKRRRDGPTSAKTVTLNVSVKDARRTEGQTEYGGGVRWGPASICPEDVHVSTGSGLAFLLLSLLGTVGRLAEINFANYGSL